MLSKPLQEFIEQFIYLIEENNYDIEKGLYNEAFHHHIDAGELTDALLTAGIDPLEHLDYIPYRYLSFSTRFKEFHVPEHIQTIGTAAFFSSSVETLYISNSLKVFGEECFSSSKIKTIIFDGTKQEFMFVDDHGASSKPIKVITKDSTFDFWGEW